MKILIIEDQPEEAELIRRFLEALSVEIEVCLNFACGLASMRKVPPADVIFLDLILPDTLGANDTLQKIKDLKACNSDVVVIVMTGMHGDQIAKMAASLGADDFYQKRNLISQVGLLKSVQKAATNTSLKGREELLERLNSLLAPQDVSDPSTIIKT